MSLIQDILQLFPVTWEGIVWVKNILFHLTLNLFPETLFLIVLTQNEKETDNPGKEVGFSQ